MQVIIFLYILLYFYISPDISVFLYFTQFHINIPHVILFHLRHVNNYAAQCSLSRHSRPMSEASDASRVSMHVFSYFIVRGQ